MTHDIDELLKQSKITPDEHRYLKLTIRMAKLTHEFILLERDISVTKTEIDKLSTILTVKGGLSDAFTNIYDSDIEHIFPDRFKMKK